MLLQLSAVRIAVGNTATAAVLFVDPEDRQGPSTGEGPRPKDEGPSVAVSRCHNALLARAAVRGNTGSGSGVKSSPGLMKRSRSNRYCLSYKVR